MKGAKNKIDSREFAGWMAFDRIHPIGDGHIDNREAVIADALIHIQGGKTTPKQIIEAFKPSKPTIQTQAEMQAVIRGVI